MSEDSRLPIQERERIVRVSDMLCTSHAILRDRYSRRALILDLTILGLSSWLVAMVFIEPTIHNLLTPFRWNPQIWTGVLALCVFFLSIVQLKVDWKGRSDAHKRTVETYAQVKREGRYLIASGGTNEEAWQRVLSQYDMASAIGIEIPEKEFLKGKRRHRIKVAVSRHLDSHPSASLCLTHIVFWYRDNFRSGNR